MDSLSCRLAAEFKQVLDFPNLHQTVAGPTCIDKTRLLVARTTQEDETLQSVIKQISLPGEVTLSKPYQHFIASYLCWEGVC